MDYQKIVDEITDSILSAIKKAVTEECACDKTHKGKIVELVNPDKNGQTNKYKVLISGATYTVTSSVNCKVDDMVWVCAPCGNVSNMFVVCKTR